MKASRIIDMLSKIAGYLKPIKCENCGYVGKPNGSDGRCPECGAICGVKPQEPTVRKRLDIDPEETRAKLQGDMEEQRNEFYSAY